MNDTKGKSDQNTLKHDHRRKRDKNFSVLINRMMRCLFGKRPMNESVYRDENRNWLTGFEVVVLSKSVTSS
ncbi:MAG: hypothetical protein GTN76_13220 [Candidatus Aenigmarchaeota archaeon]|nr:hypothetical protein [Candidatus Aenigmarchaeota archaeon]